MFQKLFFLLFVSVGASEYQRIPCQLKQVEYGYVCLNEVNYCDTLTVPKPQSQNSYTLVTSSLSGDRFTYRYGKFLPKNHCVEWRNIEAIVKVDKPKQGFKFVGFGGGFSGAVSYVLNRLPESLRKCVYNSYFSRDVGMDLSMLRLTMGGTSFDLSPWTYNETPENDVLLSNFTQLDPRDVQRNLQIKEIISISNHSQIKIFSVPYSAPPWMKFNNNFVGGAGSQLKEEYYQTWANYYLKYLHYMHLDDIPIWAVTTGDEPQVASIEDKFQFMGWNAYDQGRWIANYLAPTIKGSLYNHVKILAYDDNYGDILTYLEEMESGAEDIIKSIDAIAVHGHGDWRLSPKILDETLAKYPDKPILMTEKSFGIGILPPALKGVLLGSWERAENFTVELIENLNHNITAFLYWNFILDHLGGPNYAQNYVDSPIIVDENYDIVYKQPLFYAMAHFAKFIPINSQIITTQIAVADPSLIHVVAYLCPDGSIAMVLYNNSETKAINLFVIDKKKGKIELSLQPKSINTLIY